MKSSNTVVMVLSVRLLCAMMNEEGMKYPIHLGVTEAGNGEDGRIKSAVGIGALLADGIGDTVRVSLSEAPEREIPVAKRLVDYVEERKIAEKIDTDFCASNDRHLCSYSRRETTEILNIGGGKVPVVIGGGKSDYKNADDLRAKGMTVVETTRKKAFENWNDFCNGINNKDSIVIIEAETVCKTDLKVKAVLKKTYDEDEKEALEVKAAADFGVMLIDGRADGIEIENRNERISAEEVSDIAFGILQAARQRVTKTEYISCPGCGRTQYELEETIRRIKDRTRGLKGLKIGIMGCIVNGPGEMADADYGYVGAGKGRVSIYKGKECVEKNVETSVAIDKLIELIKKNGDWKEE